VISDCSGFEFEFSSANGTDFHKLTGAESLGSSDHPLFEISDSFGISDVPHPSVGPLPSMFSLLTDRLKRSERDVLDPTQHESPFLSFFDANNDIRWGAGYSHTFRHLSA
jgi:hypothetical protein